MLDSWYVVAALVPGSRDPKCPPLTTRLCVCIIHYYYRDRRIGVKLNIFKGVDLWISAYICAYSSKVCLQIKAKICYNSKYC